MQFFEDEVRELTKACQVAKEQMDIAKQFDDKLKIRYLAEKCNNLSKTLYWAKTNLATLKKQRGV